MLSDYDGVIPWPVGVSLLRVGICIIALMKNERCSGAATDADEPIGNLSSMRKLYSRDFLLRIQVIFMPLHVKNL